MVCFTLGSDDTAATLCWGHSFCLQYDDAMETQLGNGADAAVPLRVP